MTHQPMYAIFVRGFLRHYCTSYVQAVAVLANLSKRHGREAVRIEELSRLRNTDGRVYVPLEAMAS